MEAHHSTCASKVSDVELVAATRCGNAQAFEQLFLRHQRRILSVAHRIVNNREDAEDVMQECFYKAFMHLGAFQEKSRFSTWLTRIAMNEAYMVLRKRRRGLEVSQENPDDGVETVESTFVDRNPNPEQICTQRERSQFLTRSIDHLSPKIRSAILLYDVAELSGNETAQALGTTISAVKSRLNHGHQRLRDRLSPVLLQNPRCEAGRFTGSHV